MKSKILLLFLTVCIITSCVGTSSKGVFGTGVTIALDPRSLGTQIDDSIMQKNLIARLTLREKSYFLSIFKKKEATSHQDLSTETEIGDEVVSTIEKPQQSFMFEREAKKKIFLF